MKGAIVAAKKMRQERGRRRHRAPIQIGIVRSGPGDVHVGQDADDNDRRDGELRSGPGEDGGRPMPPQHDGRGRNQEHDRQVIRDAERAAECRENHITGSSGCGIPPHEKIDDGGRQRAVERKGFQRQRPFPEQGMNSERKRRDRGREVGDAEPPRR